MLHIFFCYVFLACEQVSLREVVEKIREVAPGTFLHLSRDEIVTWARNRIIHTFMSETAVIYTDFAAQIKHRADVKGTCEAEFSSNLDIDSAAQPVHEVRRAKRWRP
jgi:hypothetical protein